MVFPDDTISEPADEGDEPEIVGVGESPTPSDDDSDLSKVDEELGEIVGKAASDQRLKLIKYDPVTAYMQEARRYPLLDRDEEQRLAIRYLDHGDLDAARSLVEANLRLVVKIAYEYRRASHNLLDLIQEGNIGLMKAVKKYDPHRGVKLSSYAAWWIRAYILRFVLNNWRMVKIGTTQAQRKLFFNLKKEKERLEQLGFRPTAKLIAENLDVSEKEVEEMEIRLSPEQRLDAPIGGEDGARTKLDFLEAGGERPDSAVAAQEFQGRLKQLLEQFAEQLEGRDLKIFRERWLTEDPKTLQQLGDDFGVSRERARQLEKRLMGKVKVHLQKELGADIDIGALGEE